MPLEVGRVYITSSGTSVWERPSSLPKCIPRNLLLCSVEEHTSQRRLGGMLVANKLRTFGEGVHFLNIKTKPQKEVCSFFYLCGCNAWRQSRCYVVNLRSVSRRGKQTQVWQHPWPALCLQTLFLFLKKNESLYVELSVAFGQMQHYLIQFVKYFLKMCPDSSSLMWILPPWHSPSPIFPHILPTHWHVHGPLTNQSPNPNNPTFTVFNTFFCVKHII